MKRNPYYSLEMLNGVPYLLPFGQNIADQKRSFMVNETGVFIWNHLEEVESEEAMIDLLLVNEEIETEDLEQAKADLKDFMKMLKDTGVIVTDRNVENPEAGVFSIAGILMSFHGSESYIPKPFESFRVFDTQTPDLKVDIFTGSGGLTSGETVVIHNKELNVFEGENHWHLEFPAFNNIESVLINKALNHVEILIRYEDEKSAIREQVFHVMRHLFLLKAQSLGMFAMHSASILYRGKAYLFSGPSGTGKSTHTKLWHELFGTEYLNGDLNLLSDEGTVFGIPWCGTSELFTVKQHELGGIVFLKQAKENSVELLSGDEKSLRIGHRLISPAYTKDQLEENLSFSVNLGNRFPAWRLKCTKDPEAAILMKETIDHFLNRSV